MKNNIKDRILIIIPARDEVQNLPFVLEDVKNYGFKNILVIDDSSEDSTFEVACNLGAKVVRLPFPLGSWIALQTGFKYATIWGYDVVVSLDADGQHQGKYIEYLIEPILKHEADVTIGSFWERGDIRKKLAWKIFRILSGIDVTDLTSGFRAYGKNAIKILASSRATLLEYQDVGVLLLLKKSGLKLKEIPVQMNERIYGDSKIFSSYWTILKYLIETFILAICRR